jgi:DNA-directed RNA polymerase specialized sigma24 family protein
VSTLAVSTQNFVASEFFPRSESTPDLVALAREGNQQAFFRLFEIHKRRVYNIGLRHLNDVLQAENMTRQVFLESFSRLNQLRDDTEFSACVTRNMVNAVTKSSSSTLGDRL